MHFLNPAALLALAAATIPLAIHFLHRGRSQPLAFSNLYFLRLLHQNRMRSIRLRQWFILLLRTLAITALAIAFSRPALSANGWFGRPAPVTAAILLDTSYSTGFRPTSVRLFDRLRSELIKLLKLFSAADHVRVIPFAAEAAAIDLPRKQLVETLGDYSISQDSTNLEAALRAAERHFDNFPQMQRELYICSDFASPGWSEVRTRRSGPWLATTVYAVDLETGDRENCYVATVTASSWLTAPGNKWHIQADIVNASSHREALGASLFIDGMRVQRRMVNLAPGERKTIEFATAPRRAGSITGYVQIDHDALMLDDRRYFTADIPDRIGVLAAGNGEDLYFVQQALAASAADDPALALQRSTLGRLNADLLQQTNVLLLCNISHVSADKITLIHNFVDHGGNVIIFPSPTADIGYLNRHVFSGLLPISIKGVIGRPNIDARSTRRTGSVRLLDPIRVDDFLFEDLTDAVAGPRFHASFDLSVAAGVTRLLSFQDGATAVAMARRNSGRIVLFSVPLSLEWSELPSSALFVPLIHRLCRVLSTAVDQNHGYTVGQTVRRRLRGFMADNRLLVRSPSGRQFHKSRVSGPEKNPLIGRVMEAGIWRLEAGGEIIDRFAVNPNTRESDLRRVATKTLERVFTPEHLVHVEVGGDVREQIITRRYGRELWRVFVVAAVVLLMIELWIGRAAATGGGEGQAVPNSRSTSNV